MYNYLYNQNWHDLQTTERYHSEISRNQTIKFVTQLDNSYQYIRIDPDDSRHLPDTDPNYMKQFYLVENGTPHYDTTDPTQKAITIVDTLDDAIMRFLEEGDYPMQVSIE